MSEQIHPSPKRGRRWLSFSVRTMLGMVLIVSIFLGWIGRELIRSRGEQAIVQQIQAAGGSVVYDYQVDGDRYRQNAEPPGSKITRALFGEHLYSRVVKVNSSFDQPFPKALYRELPKLQDLAIIALHEEDLGPDEFEALLQVRKLNAISFGDTPVSPEQLAKFAEGPFLEIVNLKGTSATDANLKVLPRFENLRMVQITRSAATDDSIAALHKNVHLELINLFDVPQVTDQAIAALEELEGLRDFQAIGTQVTHRSFAVLAKWKSLRRLHIIPAQVDVEITDEGISQLEALVNLETLALSGTKIGDDALRSIGKLKALQQLDLCDTSITDEGMKHLGDLQDLRYLEVWETAVTDRGLEELTGLKSLEVIVVGHNQGITKSRVGGARIHDIYVGEDTAVNDAETPP